MIETKGTDSFLLCRQVCQSNMLQFLNKYCQHHHRLH